MRLKLARNTLLLLASRFGSRLLVFFLGIYLARKLGAVDFGKIVFASSFILTFTPLADFGIENFLLREVSRRLKERVQILNQLFYPRIILAVFVYFFAIALGFLFGFEREDLTNISFHGLVFLPYSLNYFFLAYFNAQEKMGKSALLKIFYPALHVFLSLFFLSLGLGYRSIILSIVIAPSVSALIMVYFYPQLLTKIKFSWLVFKKILSQTWPFAALIFIAVINLRADVLILKRIAGSAATGFYGPVASLIQTSILIPQSFALALYPLSSRLVLSNKEKMRRVYLKGLGVLFLISLPVALIGFLTTPILVPFFLGQEYLVSIPAFKIAFLSLIFLFVNALAGNVIVNSKKVKRFIPWIFLNLVVNLTANFVLIPRFSFVGAAWSRLISEGFGFFINNWFVYNVLKRENG